jgi:hypothetical protein
MAQERVNFVVFNFCNKICANQTYAQKSRKQAEKFVIFEATTMGC